MSQSTNPTHSPELVKAVAKAFCRAYYTEKDTCTLMHVEELIETEWPEWVPEITAALTAAEPFIAARVEAAVLAEREACAKVAAYRAEILPESTGAHKQSAEIAVAIRARGRVK